MHESSYVKRHMIHASSFTRHFGNEAFPRMRKAASTMNRTKGILECHPSRPSFSRALSFKNPARMDGPRLMLFLAIFSFAETVWSKGYQSQCRCYPGDECWPSVHEFEAFNRSLDGRLIATVPLASPCHDDEFGPYDASACKMLQEGWLEPQTQYGPKNTIPTS